MRKMRDSGVEWIGEVPEGWDTLRFSQSIDRISTGLNPRDNFKLSKEDPLYYVTIRNFKNGVLYLDEKCDRISYNAWRIIQDRSDLSSGDILFASISDTPQAYLIEEEPRSWNINESVFTIRVAVCHFNPRYFYYQITADPYYESLLLDATGSTFKSIKQHKLLQSFMVKPPLPEQRRIADYLDEKCAAIDGAVDELKRGIEDCKAWKKAIIFEAATGKRQIGFNAEKQRGRVAKRPMRDSGIPWIGEIPEGWEICKALYALSMPITDGPHTTPELFDHGVPFVSAEAVSCGNGSIDFAHIRGYISEEFYQECCQKYIPQRDDIFMIKSGATTGRVAIVDTDERFTIWSPLAVFRVKPEKALPKYFFYMLQSPVYQKQVELGWSYGTQQNIGMRALEQFKILIPPLPEQRAIADYLDEKCAAIDALVAEKEELIADLEAYKKSLIFELVTGKREVA